MLFSILSLISGLASLSLGSPCVTTVACSLDPLPAFSTLDKPFILRGPQNYNVFESQIHGLKDVFRLMIIQTGGPQAEFTLKDGVLQTTHGNFSAFIPAAPAIFPPKLNSVQLAKNPRLRAGFVAQHRCNQQGKRILVLTSIAEPLVVRHLANREYIYTKPCYSIDPTQSITLEILDIPPPKSFSESYQELL